MTVSVQQSIERFSDPQILDATVEEIFGTVLGWDCRHDDALELPAGETVSAVVGYGGALSGACILRVGIDAARTVVARMTGLESLETDEMMQDGIGEMCNMLAGGWKARYPELASNCGLSVPAVITGRAYNLHVPTPQFQLNHSYSSGELNFSVTIVCDRIH